MRKATHTFFALFTPRSRKKRKEYMDGLEQANADLNDQLGATQKENSVLRSQIKSVQSLFRPAGKSSGSGGPSRTRKSAVMLLCLLFSRPQDIGLDLGVSMGLSKLMDATGVSDLLGQAPAVSDDEGTESPTAWQEDGDNDSDDALGWSPLTGALGKGALTDTRSDGVLDAARRAVVSYLANSPDKAPLAPPIKHVSEFVANSAMSFSRHSACA
jgi:hypothetical protein